MPRLTGREVRALVPLQVGALLGPMAGSGMMTLVPTLAEGYGAPVGAVALAITAYMGPFAVVQLVSGSIAQRLTGRRTAIIGYAVFALASLLCALAPSFPLFVAFRFAQGVGAAFLFPILMALVGEMVAPERLGRAVGAFGVTQTLGVTLGPLVAGVLEVHLGWRWFFALMSAAAAAAALVFLCLAGQERPEAGEGQGVLAATATALCHPSVLLLSVAAAGLFFAIVGPYTYIAAWLKLVHRLPEDRIGLILGLAGIVGIPASLLAGRWVDRYGRRRVGVGALGAYAAALVGLAVAPYTYWGTAALAVWLGTSAAAAWAALNTLAVEALPALRKPVSSVYNAFRYLGYALAPPVLGLVYAGGDAASVCLVSAAVVAGSAGCMMMAAAARGSAK
jgi:predicted MFS family arabinose efflux permease